MDPTTNFLTAPTPAARAGELPSPGAGTDSSPQSSEFAGVFNGQMLKLERQALASAAPPAGLGESAVQALFGATSPKFDAIPALTGAGIDLQLAGLPSAASPVAGLTMWVGASAAAPVDTGSSPAASAQSLLAQLAASVALKDANAPGKTAPALAPTLATASASVPAWLGAVVAPAATPTPVDILETAPRTSETPTKPLTTQAKGKTPSEPGQDGSQIAAFVPVALMLNARLGAAPKATSAKTDAPPTSPPPADAANAQALDSLASAVQAGLSAAASAQTAAQSAADAQSVQVTALTVSAQGRAAKASQRSNDAAALAPVASAVSLAVQAATAPSPVDPALPQEPAQASLRLTLTPPDQAITRRLAQASGNNKQISWAALLSGAKVSDVLSGAAPAANAITSAPLAGSGISLPAPVPSPSAPVISATTPAGTLINPALPSALGAGDAAALADTTNLPVAASAAPLVAQATTAAQTAMHLTSKAAKTWENVAIEVPQGLDLEALQAERLSASDAQPSAPAAFGSAVQSSAAPQNAAATKTEAATPQALAEQRAAHYQQLADKVGEAIAQRLIAQIERGQWTMQMRMQPGTLGQIDVQLDMHAAGLDASFSADNALARELMAQGANRLRDALTEAGTTVASVWVNGDSGRQSGGNPTPGRNNSGPSSASVKKTAEPSAATVAVTARNADSDGLNVLA
ncbi:MAG: flagellar hook-length control protein FliK [Betaproteobacteria bacterium]|nr:flagellar hook-length control protein FliK [Betaproteobacteria bacterium]